MSELTWTPGKVVWRELMTQDVASAKAFYSAMFGWTATDMDMGPDQPPYTILAIGERGVGGLTAAGEAPMSSWMSYVSVPDVDAAIATATARGGSVLFGPMDADVVGRFAGIADAEGAVIGLMRANQGDMPSTPPEGAEFCWETVSAVDVDRAQAFYTAVFGWQTSPGPGGQGVVFGTGPEPMDMVADLQEAHNIPPSWLAYVVVPDVDAAAAQATSLGAVVLASNIAVPGVGTITVIRDPVGAHIGLFQPAPR
jgi:predicted enzyme related to lactoylglutathione lyase